MKTSLILKLPCWRYSGPNGSNNTLFSDLSLENYCLVVDCAVQSAWFKGKEPSCTNLNHQSAIFFQIMELFFALWRAFPGFPYCWIHLNSPESTFIHINQLFFFFYIKYLHSKCSGKHSRVNKPLYMKSEELHVLLTSKCEQHILIFLCILSAILPLASLCHLNQKLWGKKEEKKKLFGREMCHL